MFRGWCYPRRDRSLWLVEPGCHSFRTPHWEGRAGGKWLHKSDFLASSFLPVVCPGVIPLIVFLWWALPTWTLSICLVCMGPEKQNMLSLQQNNLIELYQTKDWKNNWNYAVVLATVKSKFSNIPSVHVQNFCPDTSSSISWDGVEAMYCCYTLIQCFEAKSARPNQTGDWLTALCKESKVHQSPRLFKFEQ